MSELLQLRPIQPVDLPGFQYSIARPQAGRNKYQDLADVLSQINPALAQFGRISAAKQQLIQQEEERKRKEYEAQVQAGREAAYFGDDPISDGLKKVSRKAVESGQLLDKDNAAFQIGALQAQGVTAVKGPYRDMLYNQVDTLEGDIGEFIEQARLEFIKRPEFANPSVRSFAFEEFNKVEDEFRNDVEKRRDEVRTETFKRAWLELGRPLIKQSIAGQLDINDPNIRGWLNHSAGVFKGSNNYAWNNLIKEDLKEGLTTGDYTPTEVLDFVEDLRELDLGGGIKFADADTGNAISDFVGYVEGRRATLENEAKEAINIQFEEVKFDVTDVFYKEVKDTGSVSKDTLMTQMARAVELVPHHKRDQLIADIQGSWANANKLRDEATKVVFDDFVRNIEQGRDLDVVKEELNKAVDSGSITPSDYDKLNTRLENSRDFDVQVIKNPSYIDLKNSYEEIITGFRKDKKLTDVLDQNTVKNYFSTITLDKAETEAGMTTSIYDRIKSKVGEAKAKMFVNRQYRTFDRILRNKLEVEFNKQIGLGRTIEEAKTYIQENQDTIAEKQFEGWVNDSIILAQTVYLK